MERQRLSSRLPRLAALVFATLLAAPIVTARGASAPAKGDPIRLSDAAERGIVHRRGCAGDLPGRGLLPCRRRSCASTTRCRGGRPPVSGPGRSPRDWTPGSVDVVGGWAGETGGGVQATDPDQLPADRAGPGDQGIEGHPAHPPGPPSRLDRRFEKAVDWPAIGTLTRGRRLGQPRRRRRDRDGVDRSRCPLRAAPLAPEAQHARRREDRGRRAGQPRSRRCWRPCCGRRPGSGPGRERPRRARRGLERDFVQGAGVVFIAVAGDRHLPPGRAGDRWRSAGPRWGWRSRARRSRSGGSAGLTGTHLTAAEVFQDTLATGLLAASSSPLAILQAPASWSEMLMLSQPVAAAVAVLYHAANACRLAATGRHLGPIAGALIVGTPYVVGGLTILESHGAAPRPGGRPHGRDARRVARRCSSSWGGCSSSSPSTRRWPTGSAWRRSATLLRSVAGPSAAARRRGRRGRGAVGRGVRVGRDGRLVARPGAGWSPRS